jgi:transcription elongation factor Elf1
MNLLWLDQKFASLVGTQLEQYKVKKTKPFIAQFRCPICGDSQTNKYKTRGHFYEHSGRINVKCFNCGYSTSLSKFIKTINPMLYSEYKIETLRENGMPDEPEEKFTAAIEKFSSRRIEHFEPFKELRKISQLKPEHPAKKYIVERCIPSNVHFRIYYSHTYYHWVNSILPGKFNEKALALDEPRIVFPFIDAKGYVFGCTGRSISKVSNLRYSTIIFDDTKEKVFGLETIDKSKKVYLVEGPIDSLFLTNCVAMAGSDVVLSNIADRENLVVIYDNEPRNKEIIKKIQKTIDNGYKVCIWPDNIEQKDINDMILKADLTGPAVQHIIDTNTFEGLAANMRLQQWRKT